MNICDLQSLPSVGAGGVSSRSCTFKVKNRWREQWLPRLFALPHWLWSPSWSFWTHERFPVQQNSGPSCSACASKLQSAIHILYLLVLLFDGAGKHQSTGGETHVASSFSFSFRTPLARSNASFCGRTALVLTSLLGTGPQFWKHKVCKNWCAGSHPAMDSVFPEFWCGAANTFWAFHAALAWISCPSVKSTWRSAAPCPGKHTPAAVHSSIEQHCSAFSNRATAPFPPSFVWVTISPCAQRSTFGPMWSLIEFLKRTGASQESQEGFVQFPLKNFQHRLRDLFPDGLLFLRDLPFEEFFLRFSSAVVEPATVNASIFHVDSDRGGNCKRLLLNHFRLLSIDGHHLVSFQSRQTSLCFCISPLFQSRFFLDGPWNFGRWFLIHRILQHGLLRFAWLRVILLNGLFLSCHDCSELIRAPYLHYVQALQDIVRGYLMAGQNSQSHLVSNPWTSSPRKIALNGPE